MKKEIGNKFDNFAKVFLLLVNLFIFVHSVQGQNKSPLTKYKIREQLLQYKLGDETVKIKVGKTSKRLSRFAYFNLHDNENTSVEAAKEILKKYGGTLIELENGGNRLMNFSFKGEEFTFDPNRIFTEVGIEKTLKGNGEFTTEAANETKKFAAKLKELLKNFRLIIAVHNNTNENYSIKSYEKGGEYASEAKLVNINSENDIDDFFFVTETGFFNYLKKKLHNAALQDNANLTDDGSLSVYCGKNKIPYINVESQHGHLMQQITMLESLQEIVKDFRRAKGKKSGK